MSARRPYTLWQDRQIIQLLRRGRVPRKEVARILHISVDVVHKAVQRSARQALNQPQVSPK